MSLWGANTAADADKPKWLGNTGTFYNRADVIGANASYTNTTPGIAHSGWIHVESIGNIVEFTVNDGGSGYATGEVITASGVGSVNATGTIVVDGGGTILLAVVDNNGSVANASVAANAVISITRRINTITVNAGGLNYTNGSFLTVTGGGGSGANISITTNSLGGILTFTYNSKGTGYTSAPTVTISGGTGANLTATLAGTGANVTLDYLAGSGRLRLETLVAL